MQVTTRLCCGLLLTVLSSCRSEQTAFSFRAATSVAVLPAAPSPPAPAPAHNPEVPVAQQRVEVAAHRAARPQATGPQRHVAVTSNPQIQLIRPFAAQHLHPETAARPQQPTRHDTLHILLGGLLILGGIVGGIALGGWLGLGVGAVVVLLGYYFLVLGIGGKHAWLEIFQEFFNM
ncbi:hypothetical protein [Hymenobacter sp. 102]|uniref:hypothetical protein n=1 Tax=Hymenobacter sp. 102 TaxID=3403152 RepID=UPI003CF08D7D